MSHGELAYIGLLGCLNFLEAQVRTHSNNFLEVQINTQSKNFLKVQIRTQSNWKLKKYGQFFNLELLDIGFLSWQYFNETIWQEKLLERK